MNTARRQREKLERRSQIMDAAERVFIESSLAQATMDQIARAASVSKGSLYLYFKDKEDLYLSIAIRAVDGLIEREQEVQEAMQGRSGYEWFEAGVHCYAGYALEYRNRFRVAMAWLSGESTAQESPVFLEYQRRVGRAFRFGLEALELGKLDGSVRADLDSQQCLFNLWGALAGLLLMLSNREETARRIPFNVDFDRALDNLLGILLENVKASTRSREQSEFERSGLRMVGHRRRSG